MQGDPNALRAAYERARDYVESLASATDASTAAAPFWREIFSDDAKRRNFPGFNEMTVMRRGFTYPLADRANVQDEDAERSYAEGAWHVVSQTVPAEYFERVHESAFGAPLLFEFAGRSWSGGGLVNALTADRIVRHLGACGLAARPLRILEIGAGYGQVAYQLSQQLEIARYAVVDLPENLFLTAFYLQATLPERSATFGEEAGELAFFVPARIAELEGPFDLVLNSYSFQEMNLSSVQQYFALAQRTLTDDGIFYSFNSHGKAGVARPSEYPVELFDVVSFAPVRRYPWQVHGTVPYELVMKRGCGGLPANGLDALGKAIQLGLHDELEAACVALVRGDSPAWLPALGEAMEPGPYERKAAALGAMRAQGADAALTDYLHGALDFAAGGDARLTLERAAATLPATHARVRTRLMLAALAREAGDSARANAELAHATVDAPHLETEVDWLAARRRETEALLASQLALEGARTAGVLGRARNALARMTPNS